MYFCENGVPPGQTWSNSFYSADPLWVDEAVVQLAHAAHSTIHHGFVNNYLSQSTNANLEVKQCSAERESTENTPIELTEIYVKWHIL